MKFCPNCGDEASIDQKFCEKCGTELKKAPEKFHNTYLNCRWAKKF